MSNVLCFHKSTNGFSSDYPCLHVTQYQYQVVCILFNSRGVEVFSLQVILVIVRVIDMVTNKSSKQDTIVTVHSLIFVFIWDNFVVKYLINVTLLTNFEWCRFKTIF